MASVRLELAVGSWYSLSTMTDLEVTAPALRTTHLTMLRPPVLETAHRHVRDIVNVAFAHDPARKALVVADAESELSRSLNVAYQAALPHAQCIEFSDTTRDVVIAAFDTLSPGDLVVLIQSTSFRLEEYRIRVELFKRGLHVIEHPHLGRMVGDEAAVYIDSLAYDASYYRTLGPALKAQMDVVSTVHVESGGASLVYEGGLESAKMNIGDYSGMANVGGQFPIGEVFSEARDLERVSGQIRIFAFGDMSFQVNTPATPITLVIEKGRVVSALHSTPEFDAVLAKITADEGEVWVRELGFGLNRAFSRERRVTDIGTYERMCGVHLSLGAKHAIYKKPAFKQRAARCHVDVFAVTESVELDGKRIYKDGAFFAA